MLQFVIACWGVEWEEISSMLLCTFATQIFCNIVFLACDSNLKSSLTSTVRDRVMMTEIR